MTQLRSTRNGLTIQLPPGMGASMVSELMKPDNGQLFERTSAKETLTEIKAKAKKPVATKTTEVQTPPNDSEDLIDEIV